MMAYRYRDILLYLVFCLGPLLLVGEKGCENRKTASCSSYFTSESVAGLKG